MVVGNSDPLPAFHDLRANAFACPHARRTSDRARRTTRNIGLRWRLRNCRYWVDYWKQQTGERVVYRPYQEAERDFPAIPPERFARAIQLIEPDGTISAGAAATYRTLRYAPGRSAWWWMYERIPGFAAPRRGATLRSTWQLPIQR